MKKIPAPGVQQRMTGCFKMRREHRQRIRSVITRLIFASVIASGHSFVWAEELESTRVISVLVNAQSGVERLERQQVMSIFLGRARHFPNGKALTVFDHAVGTQTRTGFFENLTGKSIADIDAYWARMRYSGRSTPPKTLAAEAVLEVVSQNKKAISYVEHDVSDALSNKDIKAVFTLSIPDTVE